MFIHTNLTAQDIYHIFRSTGLFTRDLSLDTATFGSRTHDRKVSVRLYSFDARPEVKGGNRRTMDNVDYAATWGEWGVFLAAVFAADPTATATYYKSAEDFHEQTAYIFAGAHTKQTADLTTAEGRGLVRLHQNMLAGV